MKEKKKDHDHEKFFLQICDYLGGDLDSPACKEVREHLDACPECKNYCNSIKETVKMFRLTEEECKTPKKCMDNIFKHMKKAAR